MTIQLGHCTIDLAASEVRWSDRVEDLTSRECKLLAYLSSRASEEVPRQEVLAEVWGYHPESRTHTVAVAMRRLRKKLEVDPGQPTVLRTVRGRGWRFVLPDTAPAAATNLRPRRDGFFGRAAELAALESARLTTVVGPPGIGKSRLALEYASRVASEGRAREVWLSALGTADSEADVAAGVAQILGVVLWADGDDGVDRGGHALAARGGVLVVLDGADAVTGPVGRALDQWLDQAPLCRFVVTSRQRLRIDGERVLALSSLAPAHAEALFVDRASSRAPWSADAEAVRALVKRLDGVPLAIELIAARVGLRSVATLVEELDGQLPSNDDPLAALRGAVTWTCDRLAPWERRALAQTSLFAGGFTLEAADAVLEPGAGHTGEDAIAALVDWSLLRRQAPAPGESVVRFDTFDIVSEVANGLLNEAPEMHREAVERHAHHYGALGRPEALAALRHTGGLARRRAMTRERANLAVAASRGASETAVCCGLALASITSVIGPLSQGEQVLTALLARPDLGHAELEIALAQTRIRAGDIDGASQCIERARLLLKTNKDPGVAARLAQVSVAAALHRGDPRAEEVATEALAAASAAGDPAVRAVAENNLGTLMFTYGRYAEAADCHRRAIVLSQSVGDRKGEVVASGLLSVLQWSMGDAEGISNMEAALALAQDIGDRFLVGRLLNNLISAYRAEHRADDAMDVAEASRRVYGELGDSSCEGVSIGNLGEVLLELGEVDDARDALERAVERARLTRWTAAEGAFMAGLAEARARSGEDGRPLARAAIRILERVALRRELAKAWCRLGQVEWLAGDRSGAENALSRALETALGIERDPTVRHAIDRLRTAMA